MILNIVEEVVMLKCTYRTLPVWFNYLIRYLSTNTIYSHINLIRRGGFIRCPALQGDALPGVPSHFIRGWFIRSTVPLNERKIYLVYRPALEWDDSSKCTVLAYLSITNYSNHLSWLRGGGSFLLVKKDYSWLS